MKTASITIHHNKETLRALKQRGLFADDPQWLFNLFWVFDSARDMVFREPRHNLQAVEDFLAVEGIPYTRTLKIITGEHENTI